MTPHEPSPPSLTTVIWPRCTAVHGCAGRAVERSGGCPAHLPPGAFDRFVDGLRPGADLDLRGVTVQAWMLDALLDALTGPDGRPHLGRTRFDGAVLPSHAVLRGACVEGDSTFNGACFLGGASFYDARFFGNVSFRGARFGGNMSFHGARFHRHASFEEAVFANDALFGEAVWHADASFRRAVFIGAACFDRARFGRDAAMQAACFGGAVSFKRVQVARHARLDRTRFRRGLWLGPLVAGGEICLSDATAHGGLRIHAAARHVTARGATVHGTAEFRLRHAELDLEDAVFDGTVTVRSLPQPIHGLPEPGEAGEGTTDETGAGTGRETGAGAAGEADEAPVRLVSLREVTAEGLCLTDVDLSGCGFLGLDRPDLLRITGDCRFATLPPRQGWRPWRRHGRGRAVLAEDLAQRAGKATGPAGGADRDSVRLAALYRELARAAADSDHGGLARDLRYSALEIRRHTEPTPWRRWALHLMWLTSGYGLRTGRIMAWLAVLAALLCCGVTYIRHGNHQSAPDTSAHDPSSSPGRRSLRPVVRKPGHLVRKPGHPRRD
ncbi:pentapeptide repeat-containing protein [Actinomadura rubrisoli]|uniref:pentapeptide repeat-containing protein n=1 Tax=Actinomadura rubrisoli TaxID=2530368 RepID=UPI00140470B9|nr:pentapeptide repeat-containing protein [Actinomadura rubrisoli]